jgi:hypothetical protein
MLGAIRQAQATTAMWWREVAPQYGFDMLGLDPAAVHLI